ncbi:rod shape-determining protein MreC [Bacillus spongiae]|uniref:Cell shape-determining protein MreC n=1 Tax=Bacillus spongiae TaxID=2683610 RepID=A0ABU8H909_9BACI
MPPFFRNKRLIMLLASIILLVALIGFSLRDRENIPWPEQFVKDIVGFGQMIVSKPASYVAGFFEDAKELQNTYKENQKLKARLEELASLETDLKDKVDENEELRRILNIQENLREYDSVHATVVKRNPDQWEEIITIDKGSEHGIEKNMAIRTSQGLIGKVKDVNTFSSTVELLTSSSISNRVHALVQGAPIETEEQEGVDEPGDVNEQEEAGESGDVSEQENAGEREDTEASASTGENIYGVVDGFDEEKQMTRLSLKNIPYDRELEKGQLVITSGLGGVFPKGLLIGEISEVIIGEHGLTKTAYIKPAADFYELEHVFVVKRKIVGPDLEEIEE